VLALKKDSTVDAGAGRNARVETIVGHLRKSQRRSGEGLIGRGDRRDKVDLIGGKRGGIPQQENQPRAEVYLYTL